MTTPRAKRPSPNVGARHLNEFTVEDGELFRQGRHARLHHKLGCFPTTHGARFAVWAPNAAEVSVIGEFNDWTPGASPLQLVETGTSEHGVWAGFVPNVPIGALYKYFIKSKVRGYEVAKADPFAIRSEPPPGTASVVWEARHAWNDAAWMAGRRHASTPAAPIAIYEVHLGSWMRVPEEGNRYLTYRELAPKLVEHVQRLGFTHVELMPLTEHPFYGSWGYETTGYFAATARYGNPEDLMALVDALHQAGIGVLLDWVPAHFPNDEHGLVFFDGTPLYEHPDRRMGFHPEWNTCIFDFGRAEVRSFLLSSAVAWLERFHIDGLRVDGVASMLYRDYGRKPGEWVPNAQGGNEYVEAVELLRRLNDTIAADYSDVITVAEESTAWPQVTGATKDGGLGFTFKWDMGWMHDTLKYLAREPAERRRHHNELTMRGLYAWNERFVLPLSHDEVVYGKRSLLGKMPGDRWRQFANLRLLYAYMYSQPGKKLLFMGDELAQWNEWTHDRSLDWHLLDDPAHRQIQHLVGELNHLYRSLPALHALDADRAGFQWLDADDAQHSVLVYERLAPGGADRVIVALNFTPEPWPNYRVGVSRPGVYREILNTDATHFGGSGQGNLGAVEASPVRAHRRDLSLNLTLPPLGAVFLASP
ncbi:MAG TPA: 1,4-alpha-glucan branching protein GlgB [Kofleriaceae bacterium]|nr:1,4-alpha-glucan branching protein GlgB [Kofleriaceae bacterium]